MSIQNDSAYTLKPSAQQAIRNAGANAGVDSAVAVFAYTNGDAPVFDIEDEDGNYQFSIDTDGDVVFDKNA